MTGCCSEDVSAQTILDFWFSPETEKQWFASSVEFDGEIIDRFSGAYVRAANGLLDDWMASANSALALVIALDQFPRNMFRGKPLCYATDKRACQMAASAIEAGLDQQLTDWHRGFLYMPFMHSEDLADQERSVALLEKSALDNLPYALHHRDIIRRFSRFPHRNVILGRESTPDEQDYLDSSEAFKG